MSGSDSAAIVLIIFYFLYFGLLSSIASAWSVLRYVLESKSLYAIAKRRGIDKPWLAWIPVGSSWILGCISDQFRYVARGETKNKRKNLMIWAILEYAGLVIFIIGYIKFFADVFILGLNGGDSFEAVLPMLTSMAGIIFTLYGFLAVAIVYSVFYYMALYDLFASCDPKNRLVYFLVGIFTSYPLPFFLHICRNKDLGMPPRQDADTPSPADPGEEIS